MLDLPDPEMPVKTTNLFLGIFRETFFRLCSLAPLMVIKSVWFFDTELIISGVFPMNSEELAGQACFVWVRKN